MLQKAIETLLRSELVHVPIECIAGKNQVMNLVTSLGGRFTSFNFVDGTKSWGCVDIVDSGSSHEEIQTWLDGSDHRWETIVLERVHIVWDHFLAQSVDKSGNLYGNGIYDACIIGVDLIGKDGRNLRLRQGIYPISMTIEA